MKKHLLILFVLLLSNNLWAQQIDTLSSNKEEFVKSLSKLLEDTKRSELSDLSKEFNQNIKKGVYSDDFLTDLRTASNKMILLKGKAYPQLSGLVKHYMQMHSLNLSAEKWAEWNTVLLQKMDNSRSGDSKKILKALDFMYPLYKQNALYYSKAKTWQFTTDQFTLQYNKKEDITVSTTTNEIIAYTKGDTLNIRHTSGTYYYKENFWKGKQGTVDWARAELPEKQVFCTFGAYQIEMNTQGYAVDSVLFTYEGYFNKTIKGKLSDKLIIDNSPQKTKFPYFSAPKENVPTQSISDNVFLDAGFGLAGAKILGGSSQEKAMLKIYLPNTKQLALKAFFNNITIQQPTKITATKAKTILYLGNDSIFHPSVDLHFNLQENKLRLLKGEGALAATKFFDSYHDIEFDADKVEWNLNTGLIDINTISPSGVKAAVYESNNFFNKNRMRKIRGNVSYDPLYILNSYQTKMEYDEITTEEFMQKISPNMKVSQVKPLLFKLVTEGFIDWNQETDIITIKDKVRHFVRANAKKVDYDNISIVSKTQKQNGRIDVNTKNLKIEGVKRVPISKATTTEFYPDSLKLTLKANRDMEFDGFFFCGRMDFFGKKNEFIYKDFKLNLPQIDTLIINIPDGEKLDAYGNPMLRPLNTVIENLSGNIEINHPNNKSGKDEMPEYPKLHSTGNSKIYFDAPQIKGGTYNRDNFFYELTPFSLDSLQHLEPSNLQFEGKLHSADIFPELNEPLRVQEDLSLGFQIKSDKEGFPIYKGKAKFISDLSLNGKGLQGDGVVKYQTTSFAAKDIHFFPDSLKATASSFTMEKSTGTYESPATNSNKNPIVFYPYQDQLIATNTKESPFQMYGDIMNLNGSLVISDKEVQGTGTADWDDATLISNQFQFKAEELFADTAELVIKGLDGDKVTFKTPNVNASVNFNNNTGYFKSNTKENRTEFSYNQYETDIDEFFWDITNKKLEFNAEKESEGAPFISKHPKQDSLYFLVKKAEYSLQTSIIEASGVEEILLADSRLIPAEGKVTVEPQAKLKLFENARIEANAETKKHLIENVKLNVKGKNAAQGSGQYVYKTKNTPTQYINLSNINIIKVDSTVISAKRRKKETLFQYAFNGKGKIDESENFILYPNINFYGNVEMFSSYEKLKIKGFTKIDFRSPFITSNFYEIDSEVNPESLEMDVSKAKDPSGALVRTGIFVSKGGINPIYTEILNNQIGPLDVPMIETNDILSHKEEKNAYIFGVEEKIKSPDTIMAGNILEFTPNSGAIYAQGSLNLGTDYGLINETVAGNVNANLSENQYKFNTSIAFPFVWDKDFLEKIAFYLFEDNFDADDADYSEAKIQNQLAEMFSPKELQKTLTEIETNGTFTKPKSFKNNLLLTNLNLVYDNEDRAYRSKGKFNLSFMGEKAIHKRISGYVELGHRMGADYFNIYLKTNLGDWFYINYEGGNSVLRIISSLDDVNNIVQSIDVKKRTIKSKEKGKALVYGIGVESSATAFARRMKEYATENK